MRVQTVLNMVKAGNGIKCQTIADKLDIPFNSVSGALSYLKRRGAVYNNETLWHTTNLEHYKGWEKMIDIIVKLRDIHCNDNAHTPWSEGYLSALVDYRIISEDQFESLLGLIKGGD